jgi:hypothetical protein
MISPTQQELLRRLGELCELSPDVRFGQLLAHLGFLVEDREDRSLRDVEDERLLAVVEHHRAELERRHQSVA